MSLWPGARTLRHAYSNREHLSNKTILNNIVGRHTCLDRSCSGRAPDSPEGFTFLTYCAINYAFKKRTFLRLSGSCFSFGVFRVENNGIEHVGGVHWPGFGMEYRVIFTIENILMA